MRVEHIILWTKDLERLKSFYQTCFDAQARPKYINPAKQFESYFLRFDSATRLELMARPDILTDSPKTTKQMRNWPDTRRTE